MSEIYVCPVCNGRGHVPNGFYLAVGTSYYSTTSTSPETCRSCGGKGYIVIEAEVDSIIEKDTTNIHNNYTEYLETTSSLGHDSAKSCPITCCSCKHANQLMYTSNPVKYKCTLDDKFYDAHHTCNKAESSIQLRG